MCILFEYHGNMYISHSIHIYFILTIYTIYILYAVTDVSQNTCVISWWYNKEVRQHLFNPLPSCRTGIFTSDSGLSLAPRHRVNS